MFLKTHVRETDRTHNRGGRYCHNATEIWPAVFPTPKQNVTKTPRGISPCARHEVTVWW